MRYVAHLQARLARYETVTNEDEYHKNDFEFKKKCIEQLTVIFPKNSKIILDHGFYFIVNSWVYSNYWTVHGKFFVDDEIKVLSYIKDRFYAKSDDELAIRFQEFTRPFSKSDLVMMMNISFLQFRIDDLDRAVYSTLFSMQQIIECNVQFDIAKIIRPYFQEQFRLPIELIHLIDSYNFIQRLVSC